ncbi:MAG: hypothetical protein GF355_03050 [Candidatus Eisenbacteria bacterium]|nr:hypothetical protein [Candidatus Eisenbacteria bacterium]
MRRALQIGTVVPLFLLVLFWWGCEREVVTEIQANEELPSCFGCHGDNDLMLVAAQEQWEESVHASGANVERNRNYNDRYRSCEPCHSSEGFVAATMGGEASGEHFSPIGCFTCHAPHSEGDFGVRIEMPVALGNGELFDYGDANLCASCHQGRRNVEEYVVDDVELSTHWGPHHSTQGDMLLGENAYEYDGVNYTNSPHTGGVDEGCIECHMGPSTLHPTVGGHSFNMRNELRGFQHVAGCNADGCHSDVADLNYRDTQDDISALLGDLHVKLMEANLIDEEGDPVVRTVATADSAGALFNYLYVHEDRSLGIHNTNYAEKLLESSINFLETGDPTGGKLARR